MRWPGFGGSGQVENFMVQRCVTVPGSENL